MRYTIVSCSPQNEKRSASTFIAKIFKREIEKEEKTQVDFFWIGNRNCWQQCIDSFENSEISIWVVPVYVENVPGIFLEFLEELENHKGNGKMFFILQSGFEEASQLRTAEKFLEMLPARFGCEYGGTLLKGGLIGLVHMRGEKYCETVGKQFEMVAGNFVKAGEFNEIDKINMAGCEYYSKGMILLAKLVKPLNTIVWSITAKKMGAKGKVADRPYSTN